jgi:hypothetical protein
MTELVQEKSTESDKINTPFPIRIKTEVSSGPGVCLKAYHEGSEVGNFDYISYMVEGKKRFTLGELNAYRDHKGIAKALLKEFVHNAGPGAEVSTNIINEKTRQFLEEHDPNPNRRQKEMVEITDKEKLGELFIVQVFSSGGIETNKVKAYYEPKRPGLSSLQSVFLIGVTR